jgi:FHA domain/DUF1707 SHOCT-like domain
MRVGGGVGPDGERSDQRHPESGNCSSQGDRRCVPLWTHSGESRLAGRRPVDSSAQERDDEQMRAADLDRDRAARSLGEGYAHGLLSLDTLSVRLDQVYGARSLEQLQAQVSDLRPRSRGALAAMIAAFQGLTGSVSETLRREPRTPSLTIEYSEALATRTCVLIGRSSRCDIVLGHPSVSRQHALLRRNSEGWAVRDLDSLNGTWLNGDRITRSVLRRGDSIAFGEQRVRLSF